MSRKDFCSGVAAFLCKPLLPIHVAEQSAGSVDYGRWKYPFLKKGKLVSVPFDLSSYTMGQYQNDVSTLGLEETWNRICKWIISNGEQSEGMLATENFGELYEEGLAIQNKANKKASGQYYTPRDVSSVMAEWFSRQYPTIVCDVACGVGNLILSYFKCIGYDKTREILREGRVHLYDIDETAIKICITAILARYGLENADTIQAHRCDFLSSNLSLPKGCKVISNPPYAAIAELPSDWTHTDTAKSTKELYAVFMEKILEQSNASVIITPYSFIGGTKFYPLRCVMNDSSGFVVSFDNVPGAIFCGKKHGIFNSNTGNSVRAAITVAEKTTAEKGFRFSPLIRFKNIERARLLKCKVLEDFVGNRIQKVSEHNTMFAKCDRRLENLLDEWIRKSDSTLSERITNNGRFKLTMPNTCRYFTVAVDHKLNRKGQISLHFDDEDVYWYVYCMINSSFAYWHWRLYDGGITYPSGLLLKLPLFFDSLEQEDKWFFRDIANEMINSAGGFIVKKNNLGTQENIKYPKEYRDRINRRLLDILKLNIDANLFDIIHSNMALEVSL